MSRQTAFLSAVFGTAAIMLLAQSLEYLGLEYMPFAGALALGAAIGTVVFVVLAASLFKHVGAVSVVLVSCCIAGLPFLVDWLLSMSGTQLNIHGFAILGYFVYSIGSIACATGLLIALAVRTMLRWKHRDAP